MTQIFPFSALRPKPQLASRVAALPYDVVNREEAAVLAENNPYCFLRVSRSEIELPPDTDPHSDIVYTLAQRNLAGMVGTGVFLQDKNPCFYVYRQTMGSRSQYGLVCCVRAEDYFQNIIKKHELTRADKEEDRLRHTLSINANAGPVFLTYRDEGQYAVFSKACTQAPLYDFVAADGIGHTVWQVESVDLQNQIKEVFATVPCLYIADGHHRSAAGARAARQLAAANPNHSGEEEYNRFMAILFPSNQLRILDYNRLLKTWNGMNAGVLLEKLSAIFSLEKLSGQCPPTALHEVHLYLPGQWYKLRFNSQLYQGLNLLDALDVGLLQNKVLAPLFGISDPRTSKDIDFVGGIRGLGELERLVDSGKGTCAFAMYPTSLDELMAIADAGQIMPPKSTWFEPKLRSGLLVHLL